MCLEEAGKQPRRLSSVPKIPPKRNLQVTETKGKVLGNWIVLEVHVFHTPNLEFRSCT
jgi:hypothetical protein